MTKHVMIGIYFVRIGEGVEYFVIPTEENGNL
jgi:hypothetical protein